MSHHNIKFRRKHYHPSPKSGLIYCDSSYELKAVLLLDADPDVVYYQTQIPFNINGRGRRLDFLVTYKNGNKKVVEVKPERRICQFPEQIQDNRDYASQQGYTFEIWTEKELGLENEDQATKWADEYLTQITGIDFVAIRRERACERTMKHYRKTIAQDKVEVFCEYCKETHSALRLTYDKNIARNGRYICEREGGFIAGSKPKKKKVNPYAAEGKKKCTKCGNVVAIEQFNKDKSRSDGRASICQSCNKEACGLRYERKVSITKE